MRLFAQKYLSWICFLGNLISYSQQELIQILEDEANSPFISKFGSWVFVSALIGDCELLTAFWISSTANWSSIASTMSSFAALRNHFKILKKDYFNSGVTIHKNGLVWLPNQFGWGKASSSVQNDHILESRSRFAP